MELSVSRKIFVDTQYVVALINQLDQFHKKAVELAYEFDGEPLLTTDAVLIEIGNAFSRRHRSKAADTINHFLTSDDIKIVRVSPALFSAAFSLYRTHHDKAWGMTDCISFVVMRQFGIQDALTHDRHFSQAGFTTLLRAT